MSKQYEELIKRFENIEDYVAINVDNYSVTKVECENVKIPSFVLIDTRKERRYFTVHRDFIIDENSIPVNNIELRIIDCIIGLLND